MGFIAWTVLALLLASVLIYMASLHTRRLLPEIELPRGENIPKTPVQRFATWAMIAVSLLTALAATMVAYHGADVWWDNDHVRLTVTFVLLAALAAYLVFNLGIHALERRDDGSFDERDSVIVSRASAGVGGAMMTVMAAWMIALTEAYHATQLVPSYYLYLVFWSLVMTNVIASIAGILLAYRRS